MRVFATLGIETLILTNAAGGIRRSLTSGALMLIADHINLTFRNPLIGPVLPGEERFPDMSEPYDRSLRALAHEAAQERHLALQEGVYVQLLGPELRDTGGDPDAGAARRRRGGNVYRARSHHRAGAGASLPGNLRGQ